MSYISTRGMAPELTFEQAMLTGLARDGGLYVPRDIPQMSADDIAALSGLPYEETAFRIMRPFIGIAILRTSSATPTPSKAFQPRLERARLIERPPSIVVLRISGRLSYTFTLCPRLAM